MNLFKKSIATAGTFCLGVLAVFGLASCGGKDKSDEVMTRLSLLLDQKQEENKAGLSGNLEVPYSVTVDSKDYVIDYSTDNENAKVVLPENPNEKDEDGKKIYKNTVIKITPTSEEQAFKLTAKVKKKEKTWDFKIAAKDLSMVKTQAEVNAMANLMDYATWAAASSGTDSVVQGYVIHAHDFSASYGNASVWIQDDNGGYYGYRVKVASEADYKEYFKTGNKIAIEGKLSPYNGWQEMGSGCKYYYIKDAEPKTYDFKDVTELWGAHTADSAESIAVQNQKIKVTGKVTSVPAYSSSNMTIGLSVNGQDYSIYFKSAYTTLPKDLDATIKVGYTIEVQGIAAVSSKKAQICPIATDAITVKSTEVTNQDKVNGAVAEVKAQDIKANYYDSLSDPIQLLTKTNDGCDVAYSLVKEAGTGITLTDNKLNVTVDSTTASKAKLTAVISMSDAENKTVEWTITTKTDADVIKELKDQATSQSLSLSFDETKIGMRQRLANLDSPSNKDVKVKYILAENDYVQLGQYSSGQYYFDVKAVPEGSVARFDLTCEFEYNEKKETVKVGTIVVKKSDFVEETPTPTPTPAYVVIEKAEDLKEDVGYLFRITQTKLDKTLYFAGKMDEKTTYYGATTEDVSEAVLMYVEAVTGGYHLYFKGENDAKTYINLVKSDTHINIKLEATASAVWTFDDTNKTLTTSFESETYYLGTYNTNKTMSASKISYISTSFPCKLVVVDENGGSAPTPTPTPTPGVNQEVEAKYTSSSSAKMDKTANNASLLGLDVNLFTVSTNELTYDDRDYVNPIGLYPNNGGDGTIRLYYNTDKSEGNALTITIAEGYKIVSISVTLTTGNKVVNQFKVFAGETEVTGSNNTFAIDNRTVVIKNAFSGDASSSATQTHFTSIVIVYAPAE